MNEEPGILAEQQLQKLLDDGDQITSKARELILSAISALRELRNIRVILMTDAQEDQRTITSCFKDVHELTSENDSLRKQLHSAELDIARLSGYQQRVQEFDPVSDKVAYQDQTHPIMVQPPGRNAGGYSTDAASPFGRFSVQSSDRPWFSRRAS